MEKLRALAAQLEAARQNASDLETVRKNMIDTAVAEETVQTEDFKTKYFEARKAEGAAKDVVSNLETVFADATADAEGAGAHPYHGAQTGVQAAVSGRKTPGAAFVGSEMYKGLEARGVFGARQLNGETGSVEILDAAAIVSAIRAPRASMGEGSTSMGGIIPPEWREQIVDVPLVGLELLQLLNLTSTTSDVVRFLVETTPTNNAASMAEFGTYAESVYKIVPRDENVKKIGHVAVQSWELSQDAPRLTAWIDNRLVHDALAELQRQCIAGLGTGELLKGMYHWPSILDATLGSGEAVADGVLRAIVAIEVASLGQVSPSAIGIHPLDWQTEMLRKDSQGRYIYGGPGLPTPTTIWGLRPVKHTSFTQGTPLVADFAQYEVPIRSGVAVSMSDVEGTNFRTDSLTYKARLRAAAGTDRPYSFCTVSPHV